MGELASLLEAYKAEMEIMKGEIGYLQRRADRFESYQQTHLRLMNEFSTYVVANPAENLPVIENGDAETINKQPSVQVEGTAVETSSTQIAPLSTPIQPLIAPAVETLEASVPLIQQPGTPTDYNYDEKDGNLSDGEIRDPQPPPAPLAPPAAKPLITPSKAVYERQTPIVEQEYYRPRYSFSSSESVNAKIARENAARRNRVANPCPDMRKPSGCPFGDSCKFSHDVVPFSYCFRYNDTGHCGVQGCRFLHKLFEYVPPGAEPVQPPTRDFEHSLSSSRPLAPSRQRSPSRELVGRHFVQQSSSSLEFYHHNSSSAGHSSRSDSGGVGFSREQDQGLHYKYGPLVEYVSQRSEGFPRQQHNWYSQQQHHFQSFEPAAGGNGKRARSWSRSRSADVATNRNQRPRERSGDRRDESGGFASPEPRNQSRFSN